MQWLGRFGSACTPLSVTVAGACVCCCEQTANELEKLDMRQMLAALTFGVDRIFDKGGRGTDDELISDEDILKIIDRTRTADPPSVKAEPAPAPESSAFFLTQSCQDARKSVACSSPLLSTLGACTRAFRRRDAAAGSWARD